MVLKRVAIGVRVVDRTSRGSTAAPFIVVAGAVVSVGVLTTPSPVVRSRSIIIVVVVVAVSTPSTIQIIIAGIVATTPCVVVVGSIVVVVVVVVAPVVGAVVTGVVVVVVAVPGRGRGGIIGGFVLGLRLWWSFLQDHVEVFVVVCGPAH